MIVPTQHLADILAGRRTTALIPHREQLGVLQPVRRRGGEPVCRVRILEQQPVELDALAADAAAEAGYPGLDAMRDDWCRIHGAAWTGQRALHVVFELVAPREQIRRFRGPWDPGSSGDVGPERKPAPEGEPVAPSEIKRLVGNQQWLKDRLEADAAVRLLPLAERVERARRLGRGLANAAITGDLYVLDRLVAEGRSVEAIERRLDAIDAKLLERRRAA